MHIFAMRPTAVDPATADELALVCNRSQAADAPHLPPETGETLRQAFVHGWDGEGTEHVLAARDEGGDLLGFAQVELPEQDNRHVLWFRIDVAPERRRRGVGTALLAEVDRLAAEAGRSLLMTSAWLGAGSVAFLRGQGFEQASTAAIRRLYPHLLPRPGDLELLEKARVMSSDYELLRVRGPLPDELLGAMLDTVATINDAPRDDLDLEDDNWTVDRMRRYDAAQQAQRQRLYRIIARSLADGSPAAHTVVAVDGRRPFHAEQHDTTVRRAHRGHRLGLRLKLEMLQWLREEEPQLRQIDTLNMESNTHMIRVNDDIGCEVVAREGEFQKHRAATSG